mgnify:FL=1
MRAARRLHVRFYLEAKANGMKHKFPSVPDRTSDQNTRRNAGQAIAAFVMALALTVGGASTTILLATLVIVANVIVDILYKVIDPRIKLK